jgi:hypothetical protein
MAKSIRDIPKKRRGRPKTTGRGEGILLRLHTPQLARLDDWIRAQEDEPSRPEAIRRLVDQALAFESGVRPRSKKTARKASDLAAREIENLGNTSQPLEEQQRRKRLLIRGPREFRDIRADQPKRKG